jgi:hypothetical protein
VRASGCEKGNVLPSVSGINIKKREKIRGIASQLLKAYTFGAVVLISYLCMLVTWVEDENIFTIQGSAL